MNRSRFRLRLDAFSPETDALFILLILSTLMQASIVGNVLSQLLGMGNPLDSLDPAVQGATVIVAFLPIVCLSFAVMTVVLGAAFVFYKRHPSKIRLQKKIFPVTEKDEKLKEKIYQLADQVNIPLPQIEMEPHGRHVAGGQVFGTISPYSIRLEGGLRTWLKIKPDMFKAVVLHEFAHIANRDIARSYYSQGVWQSALTFLVIPFLLLIGGLLIKATLLGVIEGNLWNRLFDAVPGATLLFMEFGGMLAVTFAIWARLLRSREFYADWRAALWGAMKGLKRIFQEQIERREKQHSKFSLFRLHPTAQERLDVLKHPEILFKVSRIFSALVGVLLAYLLSGFFYVVFSLFLVVQEIVQAYLPRFVWFGVLIGFVVLMFSAITWLIARTLGVQIQKQAMLEMVSGKRGPVEYLKLFLPALFCVGGMEFGFLVAPFSLLAPRSVNTWLVEIFLSLPALVLVTWFYFSYVRFVSVRVLGNAIGNKRLLSMKHVTDLLTSAWLWFLFIPPLFSAKFVTESNFALMVPVFLGVLIGVTILGFVAVGITWGFVNLIVNRYPPICPICRKLIRNHSSSIVVCEYCGTHLREWLFVVQPNSEIS